jgi:hypothetical protein
MMPYWEYYFQQSIPRFVELRQERPIWSVYYRNPYLALQHGSSDETS